jgi:hypothetical protein
MTNMLVVAAFESSDPVLHVVLVEADNPLFHQSSRAAPEAIKLSGPVPP